jgi:ACR3 family arsenite transporter
MDLERQPRISGNQGGLSAFKGLGLLDRLLALWILLAIVIGILLGNFVPQTGKVLQQGKFVGVSIPVGKATRIDNCR